VAHYRSSRAQYQVAYTFSHSIDNQSDPLASDEFDLQGTQISPTTTRDVGAGFIRQFDSSSGRASSDFDQRHNLVGYSLWQLPAIAGRSVATRFLNGWAIAALGAIRSGFPFTVTAPTGEASQYQPGAPYQGVLFNNPANIVNPGQVFTGGIPVAGGERLLNASAFAVPPVGQIGNSGRNAFRGPGRASLDFSLSREFSIPRWSERLRIVFRADAFNVLNHANLGLPDSYLASPTFGIAQFGAAQKGAPAVLPLTETSRQIHLMLRIRF
jgi:hypothetical protein